MKSVHLFLVLIAFALQAVGQEVNKKTGDSGTVPFEYVKEKIIVPIQLNGKTYKFLLDTGGILEISEDLQDEFNFTEIGSTTIIGINRNEIEIKTVVIPEMALGNWTFSDRKAIVSDLYSQYPYSCFELDGMIGRDFFDNVLLQFDHALSTFRLTKNSNDIEVNKAHRTKLKLSKRGLPSVKLRINNKNKYIEFDSGSGDFYSPKTGDVEKIIANAGQDDVLSFYGQFSFGITMENVKHTNRYMEKIARFEMANTMFGDFYSQFSKVSAPRIGAGILKYGKVTLDYINGWFYFEPYSEVDTIEPFRTFGFDVAIVDGAYRVKYILKGSEADKHGMESGDEILMIDDLTTTNIAEDCYGYLNGYAFEKNEKIKVKYLNSQGAENTIELKRSFY